MTLDPKTLERLSALADGALTGREKADAEALIARDPEARRALEEFKALRTDLSALPLLTPPEALYHRVLRDLDGAKRSRRSFWTYVPYKTAGAVMALSLVVIATHDLWRTPPAGTPPDYHSPVPPSPSPRSPVPPPVHGQMDARRRPQQAPPVQPNRTGWFLFRVRVAREMKRLWQGFRRRRYTDPVRMGQTGGAAALIDCGCACAAGRHVTPGVPFIEDHRDRW